MARNGEFARLAKDFGGHDNAVERTKEQETKAEDGTEDTDAQKEREQAPAKQLALADVKDKSDRKNDPKKNKLEGRLIVAERREIGSVSWAGKLPA